MIFCSTLQNSEAAGTVTILDDFHLRTALIGGGTVNFASSGIVVLTNTLVITGTTTIDGTGQTVTLSGNNNVRICSINPGVTASFINLTLANGFNAGSNGTAGPPVTDGQPGMGAAILNNGGTVILNDCVITSNAVVGGNGWVDPNSNPGSAGGAGKGAAIYSLMGNLFMTNSVVASNSSVGGAGGDAMTAQYYNGGQAEGGVVHCVGGNLVIQNSSFDANWAKGGAPGGVAITATFGQAGSGFGGALWTSNCVAKLYASSFNGNGCIGADMPFSGGTGGVGSAKGGALFSVGGSIDCIGCSFYTNTVSAGSRARYGASGVSQGGAIWSDSALSVIDSTFLGNQALGITTANMPGMIAGEGSGGAIFSIATMVASASSFIGNQSRGGDGGVWLMSGFPGGIATGGGIYNKGTLIATNCTFVGNSSAGGSAVQYYASSAPGGLGAGGALYNTNGTAWLENLTFAANSAMGGQGATPGLEGPSLGGALFNTNGTANLSATILANSTSGSNCFGTLTDQGYNLSSDSSVNLTGTGSMMNTDPVLSSLDNYGGATPTMALLSGSPAIDAGGNATLPNSDQRGHARPFGTASDIGAFESSPPYVIRGLVSGATFRNEVVVDASTSQTSTTHHGHYSLEGLAAGLFTLTPESPDYLFMPTNRQISVGPDQLNVNFHAYHWDALSLDEVTNGIMHIVIAATNGQTMRLQSSTNLFQWSSISTNTSGPSNYLEFFLPVGTSPSLFYRSAIP